MKLLIILSILFLVLYGCVDQAKEAISDVKSKFESSPLGKHCDVKNKVICYEQNNGTGFNCVQVDKTFCTEKEELK